MPPTFTRLDRTSSNGAFQVVGRVVVYRQNLILNWGNSQATRSSRQPADDVRSVVDGYNDRDLR